MKLVLQRGIGDCGIAALATYLEATYEDVYAEAAKVDRKRRGKSGVYVTDLQKIARLLGTHLTVSRDVGLLDEEDGILCVQWVRGSVHFGHPFTQHLVVLQRGVVLDVADGVFLPLEEYLVREKGSPMALLLETAS